MQDLDSIPNTEENERERGREQDTWEETLRGGGAGADAHRRSGSASRIVKEE